MMGSRYDWICRSPECGHVVHSVSGGRDRGFLAWSETRVCATCQEVRDYEVGLASDPSHCEFSEAELAAADQPNPPCICGAATTAWDHTCPRCGATMEIDATGPTLLYD